MNRKSLVTLFTAAVLFPLASATADTTAPAPGSSPVPVTSPATPVTTTQTTKPAKVRKSRRHRPAVKSNSGETIPNPEIK